MPFDAVRSPECGTRVEHEWRRSSCLGGAQRRRLTAEQLYRREEEALHQVELFPNSARLLAVLVLEASSRRSAADRQGEDVQLFGEALDPKKY